MYPNPIYLLQSQELSQKDEWIQELSRENAQLLYRLDGLSTSSSKKRKREREINWQDILEREVCKQINKQTILSSIEEYGPPLHYATRSAATRAEWCEHWGITGWQDVLLDAVMDVSALN